MNCAQSDTEMLFIEDHWDVFEDALTQTFDSEFLYGDTLELSVTFNFLKVRLLLKLFWAPLI